MDVKSIIRSLIEEKLSEATELDHSRYMRAHGKKPKAMAIGCSRQKR